MSKGVALFEKRKGRKLTKEGVLGAGHFESCKGQKLRLNQNFGFHAIWGWLAVSSSKLCFLDVETAKDKFDERGSLAKIAKDKI